MCLSACWQLPTAAQSTDDLDCVSQTCASTDTQSAQRTTGTYSPQGVAHGLTQISRQMPHDSSSRSAEMHVRREGVTPCCCCCWGSAAATACPAPVPRRFSWSCAAVSAVSTACPAAPMVRRCVRGLQDERSNTQFKQSGSQARWLGCCGRDACRNLCCGCRTLA